MGFGLNAVPRGREAINPTHRRAGPHPASDDSLPQGPAAATHRDAHAPAAAPACSAKPSDPDRDARLKRDVGGYQHWRLHGAELIFHDDAARLQVCRAGGNHAMIRLIRKPKRPCRDAMCFCNYDSEWLRADIMLETAAQVRNAMHDLSAARRDSTARRKAQEAARADEDAENRSPNAPPPVPPSQDALAAAAALSMLCGAFGS